MTQETAILYVRVSDEKQVDNTSLDEQERRGKLYCQDQNINLLQVFREEGQTAKILERPQLQAALQYCASHKVDNFIVYKLDRLSRKVANHHSIKAVLARFKVRLVSMSEHCDDTPSGRLLENMLASVAQFDNEVRGERTASGIQSRIRQGCFPFAAPLGYLENAGSPGVKIKDPATFDLVQKAFLSIIQEGKHSVEAIQMLNAWGVRTKKGNRISATLFSKMIQNKFYAGVVEAMGITSEGKHEPMITLNEWYKMQEVIIGHSNTKRMKKETFSDTFWLNKTVLCSGCGYPISGAWAKEKGRFGYYSCRKRGCKQKTNAKKHEIETAFIDLVKELTPTPACTNAFKNCLMDKFQTLAKDSNVINAKVQGEITGLRARLEKLEDSYLDGTFSKPRYKEKSEVIKAEISVKEMLQAESSIDLREIEKVVDYDLKFLQLLPTLYSRLDIKDRFKLHWLLFPEGLHLQNGKVTTLKVSPIYRLSRPFEGDKYRKDNSGGLWDELLQLLEAFKILYHTVRGFKGIREIFEVPQGIKDRYRVETQYAVGGNIDKLLKGLPNSRDDQEGLSSAV